MKAYLAGPDERPAAYAEGARLLRGAGHETYSPAEHEPPAGTRIQGKKQTAPSAAERDAAWIRTGAQVIVLLDGWQDSPRAQAAVAVAGEEGLPVRTLEAFLLGGAEVSQS